MRSLKTRFRFLTLAVSVAGCAQRAAQAPASSPATTRPSTSGSLAGPDRKDWVQLFNGRDLSGWAIKFKGHPLNDNFNNTFRVENGLLEVRYDKWTSFNGEFGHILYNRPFSHYIVAAEYRFANDTKPGVLQPGRKLVEGFIALQAETAPIDFRKVEVLELRGCMDSKAANYKTYYVESNPAACR